MIINQLKIIFFILIFFAVSCSDEESSKKTTIISIIKEKNTRKYNSIEKGLLDQINLDGMDVHINFYPLDNDESSIISTANNVRDDNSSIAIVIGENATLLSMNIIVPQTIIFAGCFDDLSISNINRNRLQNNNITGVYVNLDITKYIKMISDKYVDNIAYLYTKNSEMSANISRYISRYCRKENIKYHPLIIDVNLDSTEMENNIKSKGIDYIILADEDYINNNIYSIAHLCDKYSIPLINTDISEAVNTAVLFSLDFNYYYLGRQLALVLNEVINNNGKAEGLNFLKLSDSYKILINEDIAEEYDVKFTKEIENISSLLIKDGKVIKK
ncbi:ABC transporter substrate binding protein [Brachyspira intermedia]|uniref:ABC transporter substrate-binding protein n=1 Tax=Brachyspira intermedia TaxID=84377 RepID=UPI003003C820